jgi:DNA ligase (NAD+)
MTDTEYSKTVDLLNKATQAYDIGNPFMTDKEWDDLYFQVKQWEKNNTPDKNSPTQSISYEVKTSLTKVEHNHLMLSLQKSKDINDIKSFIGQKDFVVMGKMDGLTCSLTYKDGKLLRAETRGNGTVGEDIIHNARVVKTIPQTIPYKDEISIDGEIICTYSNFEKFSDSYKNPRNFAAGSIRLLDSKECEKRNLTFVAWDITQGIPYEIETFVSKLKLLLKWGFFVVPYALTSEVTEEVNKAIVELCRQNNYPIDGLVYKFNDIAYGISLGATEHHFNNAIAYKFYDETYDTILRNVEWTMGRTGTLTPVGIFDSIDIDGTEVSRASLHNVSVMKETLHGTGWNGQKIQVSKRNMIIPQIEWAEEDNGINENFNIPEICNIDTYVLTFINPECSGRLVNRLDHFCGKKGLDIKGLSLSTLEKLITWGWVNTLKDIYALKDHEAEWKRKPGFGEKSVSNILSAIENSKNTTLDAFLTAIGIPLIGKTMTKELVKVVDSYEDFREKVDSKFNFSKLNGFAESKTDAILKFDYTEADEVYKFLNISNEKSSNDSNGDLNGTIFVITGKLSQFKNRAELQSKIESLGGKVTGSISKNTNYLINNDINSTSTKNTEAKKLGVPIISESQFCEMFL